MYKFVILSALMAVCAGSALPLDTPEVAQAKAAHLAAVEQEKSRNLAGPWAAPVAVPVWRSTPAVWSAPAGPVWNAWSPAPIPAQVYVANGHVQDTPEVVAEKAKHFALVADAAARAAASPDNSGAYDDGSYRPEPTVNYAATTPVFVPFQAPIAYTGAPWAPAAPIVVSNGQVQDTPEVAAAKAQHFAAHRAAGGALW